MKRRQNKQGKYVSGICDTTPWPKNLRESQGTISKEAELAFKADFDRTLEETLDSEVYFKVLQRLPDVR